MLNLQKFIQDHPQKFEQFKINDLLFVEYHCIIEETKQGFWTPNNYFVYVLTGEKKWKSQGKEYIGKAHDSLFIKKGAYIAHQSFEEEFCALLIFLPNSFIKKVVEKYSIQDHSTVVDTNPDSIFHVELNEILSTYFHSVLQYFPQSDPPPKELLEVKFKELIINILSGQGNKHLTNYFKKLSFEKKISIRNIMEANFTHNMNLEEFAKLSGRSLSSFRRDFKNIYNTTPGKWLTEKRLNFSQSLIETTNRTISEIAFESGFEHPSHFSRVFKKKFGLTPIQFREEHV